MGVWPTSNPHWGRDAPEGPQPADNYARTGPVGSTEEQRKTGKKHRGAADKPSRTQPQPPAPPITSLKELGPTESNPQ